MPREATVADAPVTDCATPWGWVVGNGLGLGRPRNPRFCNGAAVSEVFEKDQYYFHPDHLGSSSYVTDVDGEIYQHLEYFPFGETWIEESSNTQRTPYLFTGKELDEETGLYYFGARYYDPRTSVWQSPDPILASYMGGSPVGGVYVPANLSLFSYGHQSPVRLSDPNGQWVEDIFIGVPSIGLGLWSLGSNVYNGNWGAASIDAAGIVADAVAIAAPGVPGGAGIGIKATREGAEQVARRGADDAAAEIAETGAKQVDEAADVGRLADDELVCRGGTCTADRFENGSGVTRNSDGTLEGVSVQSSPGATLEELTSTIPNKQVGVTTVGDVRAAGGDVVTSPTPGNPNHATMSGIDANTAEQLFTPTIRNPSLD